MAKAIFPYTEVALPPSGSFPNGMTAHRPLVLATVIASNGRWVKVFGLLDSGADTCLLQLNTAIVLNLDILDLPKSMTGGVGSQSNVTYYDTVTIDIGQGIEFSAYVGFTSGLDATGFGLLGQSRFFEQFDVEFLHSQKIFAVEKS